jgi:hydrogenase nickel incorporation protein HypA/HybF
MHELGIADELVNAVAAQARGRRVKKIVVELGMLSAVLPEALKAGFQVASEGSPIEGAELEIVQVPGRARCPGCGAEMKLEKPISSCECGRTDLSWLSGDQMRVVRLD